MTWRVHLSDDVIFRLDVLPGTPDVLCAWVNSDEAAFFHLQTGATLGTFQVPMMKGIERGTQEWEAYIDQLCAPNGVYLPCVRTDTFTIRQTLDSRYRLYEDGHGLFVDQVGKAERTMGSADKVFVSVQMDRALGVAAALDEHGKLYLYLHEQSIRVDVGEIDLKLQDHILPEVVIGGGGDVVFASDGVSLVRTSRLGNIRKRRKIAYPIGKIACSLNAYYCATTDTETGIIRVYEGEDLTFSHQKFAIDLFAAATQTQLMAGVPTPRQGVSALAITNAGWVAFAMEGIVTVVPLAAMEKMPA